jgi:hypothetical protein
MADWEEEFEAMKVDTKAVEIPVAVEESEDIIKTEYKPVIKEEKEHISDYERAWQEKNKERLEKMKAEEKAFSGLDEKTKIQKMLENKILNDVSEFIGDDVSVSSKANTAVQALNTEKDFIDLAVSNVGRVKSANKPQKFMFSYLKNTLDLLAPNMESEKISQLVKELTAHYTKKKKEESALAGKKPKTGPSIVMNKGVDRADRLGGLEDFGGRDEPFEDEEYVEDDFM